jgi:phage gp29-like protein
MDILRADIKQVVATINNQLIKPYVELNYGHQKSYPKFRLPVAEPEDINSLVNAVKELVPLGFRVGQSHMRSKLAIPDPDSDEELLGSPSPEKNGTNDKPELNHQVALNSDLGSADDDIDALIDDMIDWEPQMSGLIDPVQQLLDECETAEEFSDKLPELMARMDDSSVIDGLAEALFKARGLGDATNL